MDRRDFLRASLAAAAVVAVPTLAMAAVETSVPIVPILSNPNQHIIDALRLYDEVLAQCARYRGRERYLGKKDPELKKEFHASIDDLLNHICKTFEQPEKGDPEVRAFMKSLFWDKPPLNVHAEIRKVPPTIIEKGWPFAMMKSLLRDHAMPIDHRALTTFKKFHETYGWAILEG